MNSPKKIDDRVGYIVPGIGQAAAVRPMARRCLAETFSRLYDREPFEPVRSWLRLGRSSMSTLSLRRISRLMAVETRLGLVTVEAIGATRLGLRLQLRQCAWG